MAPDATSGNEDKIDYEEMHSAQQSNTASSSDKELKSLKRKRGKMTNWNEKTQEMHGNKMRKKDDDNDDAMDRY